MPGALNGITVVDVSTLFAGPLAATILGDYGADVIKVEHPAKGDPARGHGPAKDGVPLWWTALGRNKQTITLDARPGPPAPTLLKRLLADADVLIENFRPGTLERWGLGPGVAARDQPAPGHRAGHRRSASSGRTPAGPGSAPSPSR